MKRTVEFERRVRALKGKPGINPYAVATAQLEKEGKKVFKRG